jgi:hypothetical protein
MSKLYSPTQIGIGTYVGGPLAAMYFLKGNYDTLGDELSSKKATLIGIIVSLLIIGILPFIPEHTPNMLIPMLYLIPVILIAKKEHLSKIEIQDSSEYSFQSSWKAFGMSILWMVVFFILTFIYMFALELLGI